MKITQYFLVIFSMALVQSILGQPGSLSENWIATPENNLGNDWLGSDSGRGIVWVSGTSPGNPFDHPAVVVLSDSVGTLQVINPGTGNFLTSGNIGLTGDSTLSTYRLDAFDDGVLVTNGFRGSVRVSDDILGNGR